MIKLSAIIITFNEAHNISRCIAALLPIADEIVVVDAFSTDDTQKICLEKGIRLVQHPFENYGKQKGFACQQAKYPYVLSVDADEVVSDTLTKSILAVKKNWIYDGYTFNRLTFYCGKPIRYGDWYPDRKLRLFDKRMGKWNKAVLHDKVVMKKEAKVGHLKGDLLHYSFNSIQMHLQKVVTYTAKESKAAYEAGKDVKPWNLLINPIWKFFSYYLLKRGFRDGWTGFIIAVISSYSTFIKYAQVYELQRKNKKNSH